MTSLFNSKQDMQRKTASYSWLDCRNLLFSNTNWYKNIDI